MAYITEIRGNVKDDNFSLRGAFNKGGGELIDDTWKSLPGETHAPYSISKRERGLYDQPNGQFKLTADLKRFQSDVDYNRVGVKLFGIPTAPFGNPSHNRKSNSDIRHNGHLERHMKWYGTIPITRVN